MIYTEIFLPALEKLVYYDNIILYAFITVLAVTFLSLFLFMILDKITVLRISSFFFFVISILSIAVFYIPYRWYLNIIKSNPIQPIDTSHLSNSILDFIIYLLGYSDKDMGRKGILVVNINDSYAIASYLTLAFTFALFLATLSFADAYLRSKVFLLERRGLKFISAYSSCIIAALTSCYVILFRSAYIDFRYVVVLRFLASFLAIIIAMIALIFLICARKAESLETDNYGAIDENIIGE